MRKPTGNKRKRRSKEQLELANQLLGGFSSKGPQELVKDIGERVAKHEFEHNPMEAVDGILGDADFWSREEMAAFGSIQMAATRECRCSFELVDEKDALRVLRRAYKLAPKEIRDDY